MSIKRCSGCREELPVSAFWRNRSTKDGFNNQCKACNDSHRKRNQSHISDGLRSRRSKDPRQAMFQGTKDRAKKYALPFTITLDDVVVPSVCPILGIPVGFDLPKRSPGRPSIDRIDNTKGYVPGNVAVISHLANCKKRDNTIEELESMLRYMRAHLEK